MKTKLITLMLFISTFLGAQQQPQVWQKFRAVFTIVSSTDNGAGNYTIAVNSFQDPTGVFNVADIQTGLTAGDPIWIWTLPKVGGLTCQRYKVSAIVPTGIGTFDLTVFNPDNTGFNGTPQEGSGNPIFEHTPNNDMPQFISSQAALSGYINADIQTCVEAHRQTILDNISAGGTDVFAQTNELNDLGDGRVLSKITMSDANVLTDTLDILALQPLGIFSSDLEASATVPVGKEYYLSATNIYGYGEGMRRRRVY